MQIVNIPAWELQQFLTNAAKYLRVTMSLIGIILGIVALVWGFVTILKGLMASGQREVPWMKGIALILLGGVVAFGTWNTLYSAVGKGMNTTITNMGNGNAGQANPETVLAPSAQAYNHFVK